MDRGVGVRPDLDQPDGRVDRFTPLLAPAAASRADDRGAGPRRRRHLAGPAPRPRRRCAGSPGSGATWLTCRARSMSCFIVRTKSPPLSSSWATTSARSSPATQAWAAATKPGSGGRCSREADRSLVGGEVLADGDDPPPARARRRSTGTTAGWVAPGCGARRRTSRAARPASAAPSPSSTPDPMHSATSRSLSWNTPRQHRARCSERPVGAVAPDVAAPAEHVEDPVELGGQRLVVTVDALAELDQLALEARRLSGRPQALAQVGVHARRDPLGAPARPCHPTSPGSAHVATRSPVLGAVRLERRRQADVAAPPGRLVEVVGREQQQIGSLGDRRESHPALAVGAGHDDDRAAVPPLGRRPPPARDATGPWPPRPGRCGPGGAIVGLSIDWR